MTDYLDDYYNWSESASPAEKISYYQQNCDYADPFYGLPAIETQLAAETDEDSL